MELARCETVIHHWPLGASPFGDDRRSICSTQKSVVGYIIQTPPLSAMHVSLINSKESCTPSQNIARSGAALCPPVVVRFNASFGVTGDLRALWKPTDRVTV